MIYLKSQSYSGNPPSVVSEVDEIPVYMFAYLQMVLVFTLFTFFMIYFVRKSSRLTCKCFHALLFQGTQEYFGQCSAKNILTMFNFNLQRTKKKEEKKENVACMRPTRARAAAKDLQRR